jgi:hypothetical protein
MTAKQPPSNGNNNGRVDKRRHIVRTAADLEWLNNGFDEELMRASDERDLQRAIEATPTPKHWEPISTEPVR